MPTREDTAQEPGCSDEAVMLLVSEPDPRVDDPAGPARAPSAACFVAVGAFVGVLAGATWLVGAPFPLLVPYAVAHLAAVCVAVRLRDRGSVARWFAGFCCVLALSGYKSGILNNAFFEKDRKALDARQVLFFATTALWECSNAALVFGGRDLQARFGITSYRRALIAAFVPCQVRFVSEQKPGLILRRSSHLGAWFLCSWCWRTALRSSTGLITVITSSPLLEAEAIALLTSSAVLVLDVPGHLTQIAMDLLLRTNPEDPDLKTEVILPYGSVLWSLSAREFWAKWSRPATQLIRLMIYYPLGGRARWWLSVPCMFLLNASAHYDVSFALVHARAEREWNLIFGVLGCAALIEILASDQMVRAARPGADRQDADAATETRELPAGSATPAPRQVLDLAPLWFKVARGLLAHASLVFAVYLLFTGCFNLRLVDVTE